MTVSRKTALIFVLAALWLTAEFWILGPYSYVRVFDVGNLHIPQNITTARHFWEWGSTFWYPHALGGIDLMAEGYRATNLLYMSLPYYLFPAWLAYPLFLFGTVFAGGYFTCRLAREHAGLSEEGSLFAGLSMACVLGFWANCLISVLAVVLFCLNKIHEKSRFSAAHFLWVVPLSLLFASGSSFVFDHVVLLLMPFWFVLVLRKRDRRFWFLYFLFAGMTLVYYWPTLWAQFANAPASNRVDNVVSLGEQFVHIFEYMFLVHDYRPGHSVFPLLWSLGIVWALWKFRFQNSRFNRTLALFLLLAAGAFFLNTAAWFLQDAIGFFKGVRFNYTLESLPLFFALAGAFALEARRPLSPIMGACVAPSSGRAASRPDFAGPRSKVGDFAKSSGASPSTPFGLCESPDRRFTGWLFAALFLCTLYPKVWNGNRWLHGDSYHRLFRMEVLEDLAAQFNKDNLFRVGSASWGIFHPVVEAYGLEAVDGYVHLYSKRMERFMGALLGRDGNVPVGNRVQLISDRLRKPLLSLANVRYLLSELPGRGGDLRVTENREALPRFFVARSPRFFENPDTLLKALRQTPTAALFRESVFLEEGFKTAVPFSKGNFQRADIKVEDYSPDRIRLALRTDGFGILVASNSYSPYWHAFVDGKETAILPAYHAFWGIPVTQHNKEIVFVYDPPYKAFFHPR